MASKSEIVRITYKELESSVHDKDKSLRNTDRSNIDGNFIHISPIHTPCLHQETYTTMLALILEYFCFEFKI
jgi:hypothetical protein